MAQPPQPVMIVCMCVCILRPLGKEDENAGWAGAKAMLSDVGLLKALQEYRKDDMKEKQISNIKKLLNREKEVLLENQGEKMKSVSKAGYGLLQWVLAMTKYYEVAKGRQDGDVNTEALRQQAKQTLLDATSNGQLDAALSRVKESKTQGASDADALRMQAKQTLLEATANGKLDAALGRLKDTKTDAPASDYEALRLQAKQTLLEATSNGKLDKALGRLSESKGQGGGEDTEALRKQAKQTLLAATESGKLDTALTKLKDSKAAPGETENKPPEVNKLSIPGAQDLPAHMKPSASPRMPSKMRTAS